MTPFLTRQQCEAAAARLLIRYQLHVSTRLALPVDVDLIGELMCDLTWDWAPLEDIDGQVVWARLVPGERRVEMNERYASDLAANEGLDRFTRAHEIGHWELHATHPTPHQLALFPLERSAVEPVFCHGLSNSWLERHADWFAGALPMPADCFLTAARGLDLTTQEGIGTLKGICNVSWAALSIRLRTLCVAHRERDGGIWRG